MRGHKLSLVWMGYRIEALSRVRATSIGCERGPEGIGIRLQKQLEELAAAGVDLQQLPKRESALILRYANDVRLFTRQVSVALKTGGTAVFVVGNSCLKGQFVKNAKIVSKAAIGANLKLLERAERDLPPNRRYLPPPTITSSALEKRMRTENLMIFEKVDP